jgi:uncharacterized protein YdhG (YjbR/CyaY superfamily)
MNERFKFVNMEDYFASVRAEVKHVLEEVRKVIKAAVLVATETISYQLPAF